MKVFKFGGASVKDSSALLNTVSIIRKHAVDPLLVVVSAMGKTTNALERILALFRTQRDFQSELNALKDYHRNIVHGAFDHPAPVLDIIDSAIEKMTNKLSLEAEYDLVYDQIIGTGEYLSSVILSELLSAQSVPTQWIDAQEYIVTDDHYREANVNWDITCRRIQKLKEISGKVLVTQGFIGSNPAGLTTSLGREGSDFSAAIFASCLQAVSVTIWKDVPGVMSADPKRLPGAVVFSELPYKEAAEMTYYGASVIHPKTIKPLANRNIPLYVKNFDDPTLPGTVIHNCRIEQLPPLIVFKENQCLISCKVTDYTFINEQQLTSIFSAISDLDIRINVMQNSAISFSFCIDFRESKVEKLIARLSDHFEVYYNAGLTLITVKNYDRKTYEEYRKQPGLLMEQASRSTLQVLVRPGA
jgi:aspartate kinase